jgi:uncharacterized protein (TIGR03435 family)
VMIELLDRGTTDAQPAVNNSPIYPLTSKARFRQINGWIPVVSQPAFDMKNRSHCRKAFAGIFLSAWFVTAAFAGSARAQSAPGAPLPSFEVASIKINHTGSGSSHWDSNQSRLVATNLGVKTLIVWAYDIQPSQLSGGPGWINTVRFDINAKVDDALVEKFKKKPEEQRKQWDLMLQSLLAERFNLKVTHSAKELPIYALVVAKSGVKFQESEPGQQDSIRSSSHGGGPVEMEVKGVTMATLAQNLSRQLDRSVFDRTGLRGKYDFKLQYWQDQNQGAMYKASDSGPGAASASPPDSSGPTIFTAIQEQLGLKLEATKGPVETIVIEHIDMPTED